MHVGDSPSEVAGRFAGAHGRCAARWHGVGRALEEHRLVERFRANVGIPILKPVPSAAFADLDLTRFAEYLALPEVVPPEVRDQNHRSVEHQLRALRFTTISDSPTVRRVLSLCPDPSKFLPGAYVQFRRVGGINLTDVTEDDRRIAADLSSMLRALDEIVRANVHTLVNIIPGERETRRPNFPIGAISEKRRKSISECTPHSSVPELALFWRHLLLSRTVPRVRSRAGSSPMLLSARRGGRTRRPFEKHSP